MVSEERDVVAAYFQYGEYNVIVADFSTLVKEPCLSQLEWSPRFCAECIAQFVDFLAGHPRGVPPDSLHLIGYSMGAHIAGLVANHMSVPGKLGRITGQFLSNPASRFTGELHPLFSFIGRYIPISCLSSKEHAREESQLKAIVRESKVTGRCKKRPRGQDSRSRNYEPPAMTPQVEVATSSLRWPDPKPGPVDWGGSGDPAPSPDTYTSHTKQFGAPICCEPFLEDAFLLGDAHQVADLYFRLACVPPFRNSIHSPKQGIVLDVFRLHASGSMNGLDPTIFIYMGSNRSRDLDPTDAHFVDVIHTGAGILGQWGPNGHADFYVNGGTSQPGCASMSLFKYSPPTEADRARFPAGPLPDFRMWVVGLSRASPGSPRPCIHALLHINLASLVLETLLKMGRGSRAVRLVASNQGEPGSTPGRVTPGFSQVEIVLDDAAGGGFSRGSPVSLALPFRRCSMQTSSALMTSRSGFNPRAGHSGFSHVGIVPDDFAGRWIFSGISRFPRPCIPALLHSHFTSPSSALKISLLRAAQISELISTRLRGRCKQAVDRLGEVSVRWRYFSETLSCDHTKVTPYFIESINSKDGFWASPCTSQLLYFLGWCTPTDNDYILMGEHVPHTPLLPEHKRKASLRQRLPREAETTQRRREEPATLLTRRRRLAEAPRGPGNWRGYAQRRTLLPAPPSRTPEPESVTSSCGAMSAGETVERTATVAPENTTYRAANMGMFSIATIQSLEISYACDSVLRNCRNVTSDVKTVHDK
ncbi:hypothetical protein PR048_023288 [Dryococelus australis]|uniref:Lipase domain-containing protein n=1 Tax=Dryococelus australis TaxID=614101 RepID=A0ABQ9GTQ5_9NEOP|nr:hypothetical protein PR048_023288 [Dryococelus australis]